MIGRRAEAAWTGSLEDGEGTLRSEHLDSPYTFASRFENGAGASPEELIGAAHAGCFSMALALVLGEHDYEPGEIRTSATVRLDAGELRITGVPLETEPEVPGLADLEEFQKIAEAAKENCPVPNALAGVEIVLASARLADVATTDRESSGS